MIIDLKRSLLIAASGALALGACGDDGGGGGGTPDAADNPDAEIVIDAGVPDADLTFSGTLSLAEVSVTNEPFASLGVNGANVTVSFTDPADVTVPPQPGYENNVGACRIFVYDLAGGDVPPKGSDGGPVTVEGTSGGQFACAFNATADKYLCSSTDPGASGTATAGSSATAGAAGTAAEGSVTLTLLGSDFSGFDPKGMIINVDGFADADANGSFPILQKAADSVVVVANPALTPASTTTMAADNGFSTLVGEAPIPGGYDFLIADTEVTFSKDAATNAPAVDSTLIPNGEGFALAAGSVSPEAVPVDGSAATFTCEGSCGAANGVLKGIVVFGETTDGVLDPADPTDMPEPVDSFATFQCSGIGAEAITLDEGAMALILGTSPTRIQTSVTYANAEIAGKNNIVMSHGVVGFTDVPAP